MGTSCVKVVRYDGRYYVYLYRYAGYVESAGCVIASMIPTDPDGYRSEWHHS